MNIDWDGVVEEANDSPRGLLADLLADADAIKDLLIIWTDKEGSVHRWANSQNYLQTIGLLEIAKVIALKDWEDSA